ncbi:MAG: DUF4860 domain-containing protein [Blautia sp.]|uniref:DUF4860 domain-containing protein n=1 Tax=Blautia sp. TaxID=1955243 RepID=UPI002E78A05B|nr:DUF4860 domain-containing protein [Blautia sp.]MED9882315.1 DUF4860 domain-containing protein [Blautia sp.]
MKLKKRHMTDLFFSLSLFGVFSVCSFMLILIGVQIYRSSASQLSSTYSTRTALSYTAEKIRQHDREGSVSLTEINGETALVTKEQIGEETYMTYIYPEDNHLCELSVKEGTTVSAELGERILEVNNFCITEKGNGFLEISASDNDGTPLKLLIHLRSQSDTIWQ